MSKTTPRSLGSLPAPTTPSWRGAKRLGTDEAMARYRPGHIIQDQADLGTWGVVPLGTRSYTAQELTSFTQATRFW